MTDLRATRISPTGGPAVTFVSRRAAIPDWSLRYFGSWWTATTVDPADVRGPVVAADVDPGRAERLTAHVTDEGPAEGSPAEAEFAGARLLRRTDGNGTVTAAQPDSGLAYRWSPRAGRLVIVGRDEIAVSTAAARLAREVVRGLLLADGWQILHASAVTRPDGASILALGDKGAGKTTTGFLLARAGWRLPANDRIFVRVLEDTIRILPCPPPQPSGSASSTPSASTRRSADACWTANSCIPHSTSGSRTPSSLENARRCGGPRAARNSSRSSSRTS
ncbi:hypothetical protein [Streptomyces sp. NPDC001770]